MEGGALAGATALWLGVLTSISPCPLATNLAAISYLVKTLSQPWRVLARGALYTLGRVLSYSALAGLLIAGALSAPQVSRFLQTYLNKLLGPLLVLVGMFLLGLIELNFSWPAVGTRLEDRLRDWGAAGAVLLGMLFALSFCPVSAALFFGSLVPLALGRQSAVTLPALYGVGTGLPVLLFALLIGAGAQSAARAFNRLAQVERWARRGTGAVFLAVGVYFSLLYIFEVFG
jgi:cytochrome c-type biogenesis protein